MVQVFKITEVSHLVKAQANANTIPSMIDVPVQRTRLVDLGHLALALGCSNLELQIENGHFRAVGPHCILTTEDIPTFGKAVRFEGDIDALMNHLFGVSDPTGWQFAQDLVRGHFPLIHFSNFVKPPGKQVSFYGPNFGSTPNSHMDEVSYGQNFANCMLEEFWSGKDLRQESRKLHTILCQSKLCGHKLDTRNCLSSPGLMGPATSVRHLQ
jgi:hypothetical protein